MLAVFCAAVLAWIPVFGQAFALAVAVLVLGWPAPLAAVLFLWPIWFAGAVYALGRLTGGGGRNRDGEGEEDPFVRSLQAVGEQDAPPRGDDVPPHLRTAPLG